MSTASRLLALTKSVGPLLAAGVVAFVQSGEQGGVFVFPFIIFVVLAIVQAVRKSGLISGFSKKKELRGSIAETARRGRAVADQLLNER